MSIFVSKCSCSTLGNLRINFHGARQPHLHQTVFNQSGAKSCLDTVKIWTFLVEHIETPLATSNQYHAVRLTKVRVENSFHLISIFCRTENFTESAFSTKENPFDWKEKKQKKQQHSFGGKVEGGTETHLSELRRGSGGRAFSTG